MKFSDNLGVKTTLEYVVIQEWFRILNVMKTIDWVFCITKDFCLMASPVGVPAKPPSPVSLSCAGKFRPTLSIASMTSSTGILLFTPAKAKSAEINAFLNQWHYA